MKKNQKIVIKKKPKLEIHYKDDKLCHNIFFRKEGFVETDKNISIYKQIGKSFKKDIKNYWKIENSNPEG